MKACWFKKKKGIEIDVNVECMYDYLCCLYCSSVGITGDGNLGGYSPHVILIFLIQVLFCPCFFLGVFFVLFCSSETWTFLIEEGTYVTDCSVFCLEKEVCPS